MSGCVTRLARSLALLFGVSAIPAFGAADRLDTVAQAGADAGSAAATATGAGAGNTGAGAGNAGAGAGNAGAAAGTRTGVTAGSGNTGPAAAAPVTSRPATTGSADVGATNVGQGPMRRKAVAGGAATTPLTLERESAAIKFVAEHHPELAELLAALKPTSPAQYAQAMHDLSRASERIELARSRDPRRFELELQLWKTQSRRDLVAVRLRMTRTAELEVQLRQLIQEHLDTQQALLRLERERVAERLRKIDEQLTRENRVEMVEQQFQQLVSRPRIGPKAASKSPPKNLPKNLPKSTPKNPPKSAPSKKSPSEASAAQPSTQPSIQPSSESSTEPSSEPSSEPAAADSPAQRTLKANEKENP